MSHQKERNEFIATMAREGVPEGVARLVLRHAQTIQRLAEEECSDERAYQRIAREQKRCPSCRALEHGAQPVATERLSLCREHRATLRIVGLLAPFNVTPVFSGDPRGACVKLRVPSGRTDDWGRVGICVPTRSL